jgi:DNA-directed RNA polymerase
MLTVNAAVSEGITSIATVHDSFGCLPSRAERFREIIREEFVRIYRSTTCSLRCSNVLVGT